MLELTRNPTTASQLLVRFAKSGLFGSEITITQRKGISNHVVQGSVWKDYSRKAHVLRPQIVTSFSSLP